MLLTQISKGIISRDFFSVLLMLMEKGLLQMGAIVSFDFQSHAAGGL